MKMWRRGTVAALLALLTLVGIAPTAVAAPAVATALTLTATVPGPVVATGKLTAAGQPVAGASVVVKLAASVTATATTLADGSYRTALVIPAGLSGRASVTASFAGATKLVASTIGITLSLPAATTSPTASATTANPAPAAPTAAGTTITGLTTDATAPSGGLFGMSGQLVDASGAGIPGANIDAIVSGTTVAGSITDGSGNWQLYVPVPDSGAKLSVTLSYGGDATHGATTTTNSYSITAVSTTAPSTPVDTPTPTVSQTPTPTIASVTPTASGLVDPAKVTQNNSLIIGGVAVAVLILLTISILVFGGRLRQNRGRRAIR